MFETLTALCDCSGGAVCGFCKLLTVGAAAGAGLIVYLLKRRCRR